MPCPALYAALEFDAAAGAMRCYGSWYSHE
jgi:hypothetical protein